MSFSFTVFAVTALGFAPPLFWLWFWLKEDVHPEPRKEITLVFLMGMAMVLIAFIVQSLFAWILFMLEWRFVPFFEFAQSNPAHHISQGALSYVAIFGFALIEEVAKFGAAFFTALRSKYFDEPVDAMIYVMTAALGFAALENALFVSQSAGNIHEMISVGSFRFANAVLIHATGGVIVGASFAFSFCAPRRRAIEAVIAIFFATSIHGFYNLFILGGAQENTTLFGAVTVVVVGALGALVLFERAKRLKAYCESP